MDSDRSVWAFVAIASLAFAFGFLVQPTGDNQKAHYALVRALAEGRPTVDEVRTNPSLRTIDVTERGGHLYAAKSPGLAMYSLPAYFALKKLGVETTGDTTNILWALHLWAAAIPALVLLLLVRRLGDDVAPGRGIAAAVTLGVATLVLPFATLFFSHLLAAVLAFGAFAVLWSERKHAPSLTLVATAGLLVGLAVTVENSAVIPAAVLGVYALVRAGRLRRAAAFVLGFVVGIAPTLLFNWWAFGSPLQTPYEGWHAPGEAVPETAFGFVLPTVHSILIILLYPTGIILLTAGIAGVLLLLRSHRTEAIVILSIAAAFVLANAASPELLGGASPGPRYLTPALPFLALGLALAFDRFPGQAVGLAVAGATMLGAATITSPLGAFDQHVIQRLRSHSVVETVFDLVGIHSGFTTVLFVLAVALSMAAAARAARLETSWRHLAIGVLTAAAFAVVATQIPRLLDRGSPAVELAGAVLLVTTAVSVVLVASRTIFGPSSRAGTISAEHAP